jgi:D-alanyl-lipoteichoic acid acyltransferase DltB (MBOAT superfamily)
VFNAWQGVLAYGFQLYFDFSGYSDMAIGLARMFNVRLPFNFDAPYRASSIIDFWRRWHMTLSAFLRDYLYVPLGGNRKGPARRYANLMVTMLLGGLWHGAAWTFVAWGAIHGFLLLVNHAWRGIVGHRRSPAPPLARLAGWALTFIAVTLAWIPFRADSMATARRVAEDLLALHPAPYAPDTGANAFPIVVAMAIAWLLPTSQRYVDGVLPTFAPGWLWKSGAVIGAMLFFATRQLSSAPGSPFLYFNF